MEVHRVLGPGFLEGVYRSALKVEFRLRGIQQSCEVEFPVYYKGSLLDGRFRVDFVCYNSILLEIKAIGSIGRVEEQQLVNYLKVRRAHLGLLINFGGARLQYKRFILSAPG